PLTLRGATEPYPTGRSSALGRLADDPDRQAGGAPHLADAGVEDGRLEARVGTDQQDRVGLFYSGDRGVEQPGPAAGGPECRPVLDRKSTRLKSSHVHSSSAV